MMAATPQKFAIYKSSAGSGKTYTLVREYIRLVIHNPERYSNILAITFTNKAANEMKSRILTYLMKLSELTQKVNEDDIATLAIHLNESLNLDYSQIATRANAALTLILHNYSNFAVSTIDSFVHRLVRVFAKDLDLPVSFDVEMDEDKLISKSIDLLISKVGADPDLTMALVRFIESKMDDEKSWNIEKELAEFTKNILKENSFEALKKLRGLSVAEFIDISKRLSEIRYKFENQLHQTAKEAIGLIAGKGIDLNDFNQKNKGIGTYLNKLASKDFTSIKPNTYVLKAINEGVWYAARCPAGVAGAIDSIKDRLAGMCNILMEIIEQGYDEYILSKLVKQNIYMVAVLSEIEKVMEEFRQNENIVHISEFNKRIATIVQKEAVPFIYERIGEKYRHYLLDEFQDTSLLQWQNLIPLLENSLSANHFNMIVGDGKQAIYRWRNGEVEQFAVLPKIFNRKDDSLSIARENLFISQHQPDDLKINYRSRAEIVDFNNRFFDFAKSRLTEDFQSIYANAKQDFNHNKTGGYIRIEFQNSEGLTKEEYNQNMLNRVLEIVRQNLQHFPPDSIAILTRNNSEGSLIARQLIQNQINVVSAEVLLLSASPDVRFMISLLQFFLLADDKVALAEVLTFLAEQKKIKTSGLHELFSRSKEISPGTPDALTFEQILLESGIEFCKKGLRSLSLPEFFEQLIITFQLDPQGNNPFIQFFMDMVYDFNSLYNDSASEFLVQWNESGRKQSIIVPDATPSVRVMTIHKAKGLQFPVVIYPFANDHSKISINEAWIEPQFKSIPKLKTALIQLKEELKDTSFDTLRQHETDKSFLDTLNLLYVAMTRPKDRLYVISKDKTSSSGEWKRASAFPDAADLLHDFLINENLMPDQAGGYFVGEEINPQKTPENENQSPTCAASSCNGGEWRRKILIRRQASRVWDSEEQDQSREKGLLVHYIMSLLNTREDLEKVLAGLIIEGVLAKDQLPELRSAIGRVISRPEISSYFDTGIRVFNEKEILLKDGSILRPDRVVISGDKVMVLDYKTGKENPSHGLQLTKYAEALREMGYSNIDQQVVYLDF